MSAHYTIYKQLILADGLPLSRVAREHLAVHTSRINDCPYCIKHHETALYNFEQENNIPKNKKILLEELATVLTKEPWKTPMLKEKFFASGFSSAEWQHAVMVVAYFNFANRCAHAMNLEIEQNYENTCK